MELAIKDTIMAIDNFFLQLLFILLSARILGECARLLKIPSVLGELTAGILIGPSLLHIVDLNDTIKLLAEIGLVLLLFEVGLETDIEKLLTSRDKSLAVALIGVIAPFILGFLASKWLFHLSLIVSLFIASTLTATSIGITMRVFANLNKQKSDEAHIVLGAAVIDDILGIILLAILYQFSREGTVHFLGTIQILLFICIFLLLAPILAKFISSIIKKFEEKTEIPGLLTTATISLLLFFAWLAHKVGAPELLGGFATGLALSKKFFLPLGSFFQTDVEFSKKVDKHMQPLIHLFAPIFFVSIGLALNLKEIQWQGKFIWLLSFVLLLIAIFGKLISGFFLQEYNRVKWLIGIAMIPRGEVGLIFAEIGKDHRVFDNTIYAAMIIVIAITTMLTPFAMKAFYKLPYAEKIDK